MNESAIVAEQKIVGALLLYPSAVPIALDSLKGEMLVSETTRAAFGAMREVRKSGRQIDILPVLDVLEKRGHFGQGCLWTDRDAAGETLIALAEGCPGPAMVQTHCEIVRDAWFMRKAAALAGDAADPFGDAEEVRKAMRRLLIEGENDEATFCSIADIEISGRGKGSVRTGLELPDSNVTGGIPDGEMVLVSAPSGGGKTALMLQIMEACAESQGRVYFSTLGDLKKEEIVRRMVIMRSGQYHEPAEDSPYRASWDDAVRFVKALPIDIYDATRARRSGEVRSLCNHFRGRHDRLLSRGDRTGYRLAIFDYAQLMTHGEAKGIYEEMKMVSRELRFLAGEIDIPVVVGSQLTPGGKDKADTPKGGSALNDDCGLHITVARMDAKEQEKLVPEQYRGLTGLSRATIAKTRFGGDRTNHWWRLNPYSARFEEL